jgi:hypothetical protein
MTDPLTDAVRRIKGLQADIERLKAAQDEEGEPRLFFVQDEFVAVGNELSIDSGGLEDDAVYGDATYQTSTVDLIDRVREGVAEVVAVSDAKTVDGGGTLTENAFYNSATYQTSSVDSVAIVRDVITDRAAVSDTQSLSAGGIDGGGVYNSATYQTSSVDSVAIVRETTAETATAADTQPGLTDTSLTTTAAYTDPSTGYQTTTYNNT